jgi:hypothetical protein
MMYIYTIRSSLNSNMAKDKGTDSRFSGVAKDPRFRRPATKKSKTVLDDRFKSILTDSRFTSKSKMDPRGISTKTPDSKSSKKRVNEELLKFYEVEKNVEEDEASTGSISEDDAGFQWDAASSSDDEPLELEAFDEADMGNAEQEDVPLGDSTDRIAIMNCNWDHVTASDIFVMLQSFLDDNAPGRKVTKVTVHKSDFGAERMEQEEVRGPMIEGMPSDDEEDDALKTKEELRKIEEQRNVAIRNYERFKKKYYFAIAEFDSINTACIIYDELDGVCGGFISEAMDLRFVPEDTPDPSSKRDPVSEADRIPVDYVPPNVETGNLTMDHSKVTCSWDEDPADRKILMKKLTPAQIANLDLDAYLESASEDDEVDANTLRALIGVINSDAENSDKSEVEGDMEMSFSRAVESVGKDVSRRLAETGQASKGDVTEWEKFLTKRKEASKKKKQERRQEIEAQRLERQAAARANSNVAKKLRMEEGNVSSDGESVDAQALAADSRLEKLFSDPKFAVDPTHPSFKKSSVVNKVKKSRK